MVSYQQCVRCVMDTTDPEIQFDENGYCNHCTNFLASVKPMIEQRIKNHEIKKILNEIRQKGKGKRYDCILGISGGTDSSYTAYLIKQYGLRVLAVHMDNGWDSETSVKNIRQLLQKLAIDYESYVLDWNQFRDIQLSFLKASVPEIETPTDIAILSTLHKVALKHGVKFIISGGNYATEGILPRSWHYNAKDLKYFKTIHKLYGTVSLKGFPLFGFWDEVYCKFFKGIRIIYILNYLSYDKMKAKEILKSELDWKDYGGKHYESRITAFVQSYILPVKFNIDYRKATFSTQICNGTLDRNEAIKELQTLPYKEEQVEEEIMYIAKKFGLTIETLKNILSTPPKWYFDYPNDARMLSSMYSLYRKYFSK
ncbi:MAG: LPS biosynthesis protein WbpG [Chitinophagales bacterium]|nr:MAG: LPS biosynthesis protein WbpG [Chitinophagales bacterium]